MKPIFKNILFALGSLILIITMPSCKTKEGCGQEEKYNNPDMETTKRGKSSLFSKEQNKKMKKKSKG